MSQPRSYSKLREEREARDETLCYLAKTWNLASPTAIAVRLKKTEVNRFAGLVALIPEEEERRRLQGWVRARSQKTIAKAVERAFNQKEGLPTPEAETSPSASAFGWRSRFQFGVLSPDLSGEYLLRRRERRYRDLRDSILQPLAHTIREASHSKWSITRGWEELTIEFGDLSSLRTHPLYEEAVQHLAKAGLAARSVDEVEASVRMWNTHVDVTCRAFEEKVAPRLSRIVEVTKDVDAWGKRRETICMPYTLQDLWAWWTRLVPLGAASCEPRPLAWPTQEEAVKLIQTGVFGTLDKGQLVGPALRWDNPWLNWGGHSLVKLETGKAGEMVCALTLALAGLAVDGGVLDGLLALKNERAAVRAKILGLDAFADGVERMSEEIRVRVYNEVCSFCPRMLSTPSSSPPR